MRVLLFFLSFVSTIGTLMFILFEFISLEIGLFTAWFCVILTLTIFAVITTILLDMDEED